MHKDADKTAADLTSLCIVAPCFNQEQVLPVFYERLRDGVATIPNIEVRFLFVDDGSEDATLDVLNALANKDSRVKIASLSRNFGHQLALSAGLALADGDAVVLMDSDLQHPPKLIPQMVRRWREGYDIVSALRQSSTGESWLKKVTSRSFYWMINRLSDTPITPGAADFCLLSGRAHEALLRMPEQGPFLRGMVSWIGFRRTLIHYDAPPRAAGESKYDSRRMIRLARDAILSFSVTPIRILPWFGLCVSGCGFLYLIYVIMRNILLGDLVPGWSSLISTLLILGGLQLSFMGIIGSYIAKILEEVRRRPRFLLRQEPTAWRQSSAVRH